jgi:hypothetical protein
MRTNVESGIRIVNVLIAIEIAIETVTESVREVVTEMETEFGIRGPETGIVMI